MINKTALTSSLFFVYYFNYIEYYLLKFFIFDPHFFTNILLLSIHCVLQGFADNLLVTIF